MSFFWTMFFMIRFVFPKISVYILLYSFSRENRLKTTKKQNCMSQIVLFNFLSTRPYLSFQTAKRVSLLWQTSCRTYYKTLIDLIVLFFQNQIGKIPNYKYPARKMAGRQITNKSQWPKSNPPSADQTFWTLSIGIWSLFVICYLELGISPI